MPFRFVMLLEEGWISPSEVRLLRHQPKVRGKWLLELWRGLRETVETYQSLQPTAKRTSFTRAYEPALWALGTAARCSCG